jgi:hypothetical protein
MKIKKAIRIIKRISNKLESNGDFKLYLTQPQYRQYKDGYDKNILGK